MSIGCYYLLIKILDVNSTVEFLFRIHLPLFYRTAIIEKIELWFAWLGICPFFVPSPWCVTVSRKYYALKLTESRIPRFYCESIVWWIWRPRLSLNCRTVNVRRSMFFTHLLVKDYFYYFLIYLRVCFEGFCIDIADGGTVWFVVVQRRTLVSDDIIQLNE